MDSPYRLLALLGMILLTFSVLLFSVTWLQIRQPQPSVILTSFTGLSGAPEVPRSRCE